jgi:hypothetical protein
MSARRSVKNTPHSDQAAVEGGKFAAESFLKITAKEIERFPGRDPFFTQTEMKPDREQAVPNLSFPLPPCSLGPRISDP